MEANFALLSNNVALLRGSASKHAYIGTAIAVTAVLLATALSAWLADGQISVAGMLDAQASNPALWLLDTMPFAFALWGQYFSVVLSHHASAMVLDQTQTLRASNAALQTQARNRSHTDALTSLPNRELLLDRSEQAVHRAHSEGHRVGMLVLDIDDFTEVNQVLGQHAGDRVLQSVGMRLRSALREPATVARLGADSFAILLPRIDGSEALVAASRKISTALEASCKIDSVTVSIRACVGAAYCPDQALDAETLLNNADLAMHEAKASAGSFALFKSDSRRDTDPSSLSMVSELRHAIDYDQLELYVQPLVQCADQRIIGVEALLRWPHPVRGMISPAEFIPRAERSGLINDITRWVLQRSLDTVREMRRAGNPINVSVNLSARTLLDAEFPDMLAGLFASCEVPAEALTLEITEDTLMSDQRSILDIVSSITHMGVRFSIDDFGTGYSQLAYLRKLPVSEVKIDRSFVADMLNSKVDSSIVEATINLAHTLELEVVAEGIEAVEQAEMLASLGCDILQGYYFARPMPVGELGAWLDNWHQTSPENRTDISFKPLKN